jgi:hypothetical protein
VVAGLLVIASVFASTAAAADCTKQTVEVGIVKATGCWTKSTVGGDTVYTAPFADNPDGVDMNGFIVSGGGGARLQINLTTRVVRSVSVSGGTYLVQLKSRGWPNPSEPFPLGLPMKLDFIAPQNSDLLLTNVHFPLFTLAGGFTPIGGVATPVYLKSGGTGSMDATFLLSGIFTLMGKPQSVTIDLPTAVGQGTRVDGFEIRLKKIDAIKGFVLDNFLAKYSASQKVLAGQATVQLPVFGQGTGVGAGFRLENGTLTEASVTGKGFKIPLGTPPAGFITDLGGGFRFTGVAGADFGPYCKSLGYEGALIVGPDHGQGAYGHWKCRKGNSTAGVDVTSACRYQSGNPQASARYTDPNNAHSWECVGVGGSAAKYFDFIAFGTLTAQFGPTLKTTCCGDISPLQVDTALDVGSVAKAFYFKITGGVKLFRLPVGDVFFAIRSGGIEGGLGVGIGYPSFTNNENDPFYVGARVGGWMVGNKFQFEAKGRVALLGLKLLDAEVLMNNRATAACWTVIGFPGGAVYEYGSRGVRDFGVGCGLGDYRERFPAGPSAVASRGRTLQLGPGDHVLAVDGAGTAPRFTLRSADGQVLHTPTRGLSSLTHDYAFFVNDYTHITHVVLRHPRGTWTITPDPGSVPITNVEAAGSVPRDRVTASVRGTGRIRTLVFHGLKRPRTRLQFIEQLADGSEIPVFETGATRGVHKFRVAPGLGKRRLRVVVIEGFGSRQSAVVARYTVNHAPTAATPARVSARDDEDAVRVRWSPVDGAQGYLVQVATRRGFRLLASYVRQVSARTSSIVIPNYPEGGGISTANVFALNADGALGNGRSQPFLTEPPATTLAAAATLSARSAVRHGDRVDVRTQCPAAEGDCQTRIKLVVGGRVLASTGYQQPPDTFHSARVAPRSAAARRALRSGARNIRLVVEIGHAEESVTGSASVRR